MATVDYSHAHADALRRADEEHKREADEKATVKVFIWTLFGFKLMTIVVLIAFLSPGTFVKWASFAFGPFLAVPVIMLAGPVGYQIRKRRIRRRVEALKQAEFSVAPNEGAPDNTVTDVG